MSSWAEPELSPNCFTVLIQRLFYALSFPAAVRQPCYAGRGGRLVTVTSQDISAVWFLVSLVSCFTAVKYLLFGHELRRGGDAGDSQSRILD